MSTEETESTAVEAESVRYFFFIHATFSRRLASPIEKITHFDGGFSRNVQEFTTSATYVGGTHDITGPATRYDIMTYAMAYVLTSVNKGRSGLIDCPLFEESDMDITAFDCGRNAL